VLSKERSEFIPYTDKAIGWHTDGYYNAVDHRVRAFSLFCVLPAATGGVNQWIESSCVLIANKAKLLVQQSCWILSFSALLNACGFLISTRQSSILLCALLSFSSRRLR
jgi:hypothetical protein